MTLMFDVLTKRLTIGRQNGFCKGSFQPPLLIARQIPPPPPLPPQSKGVYGLQKQPLDVLVNP